MRPALTDAESLERAAKVFRNARARRLTQQISSPGVDGTPNLPPAAAQRPPGEEHQLRAA